MLNISKVVLFVIDIILSYNQPKKSQMYKFRIYIWLYFDYF